MKRLHAPAAGRTAPEDRDVLLQLLDVHARYGRSIEALRGVNLQIRTGTIVALLGSNGVGKTTTLRAITNLLSLHDGRVTGGEILLGDRSIRGARPEAVVAAGVSTVLEGRRVFAELTVEENLRVGAYTRRDPAEVRGDRARVMELFPRLAERRNARAGLLSGGEQQMLAIGRALMQRPRVLLLDEPSLGLAPIVVAQIGEIIREINRQGTAVLMVEQNAAVALDLCDYAYIMQNGRMVHEGPSAELRSDPAIQDVYLGAGEGGRHGYRFDQVPAEESA